MTPGIDRNVDSQRGEEHMKIRYAAPLAALVALTLGLLVAPAAMAEEQPFTHVKVSGEVRFTQGGTRAFAAFEAEATGPAAPGEKHQPAKGILEYRDANGLRFRVSVEHIHAHSGNEVHFGGVIVKSSDPALVGKHAHMVTVDNGKRGDQFSVLVTDTDTHEYAAPVAVESGNLLVKVR
jgi:hypothetical protein